MKNLWWCVATSLLVLSGCTCGGGESGDDGGEITGGGSGGGSAATGGGTGGGSTATLDVAASSVTIDRSANVKADGADTVTITVTLRGSDALPMAGVTVALSATGDGNTLTSSVTTNAQGLATGTLKSTRAGPKIISAAVGNDALSQHPTATFTASDAAHLVMRVQPTAVLAGAVITPAVDVGVEDAFGNVIESSTSITVAVSGGATLKGTNIVGTSQGIARFVDLSVETAGTYTLTFSAAGLPDLVSSSFVVSAGAAVQLAFLVQPANGIAGASLTPAVTVHAVDAFGNPAVFTDDVVLSLTPSTATLGGTSTVTPVAAVATFSDLTVDKAGTGYTLQASAPQLGVATSTTFEITHAAPASLRYVTHPTDSISGQLISPAVSLALVDAFDNLAVSATDDIAISLDSAPLGAVLDGGVVVAAVGGVATFADLSVNLAAADYRLTASWGAVAAYSTPFDVAPASPSALTSTLVASPAMVLANGIASSTLLVTVRDAQGNPVPGVVVALSSTAGADLVQPPMTTDAAGQAAALATAPAPVSVTIGALVGGTVTLAQTATIAFVACLPTTTRSCYTGPAGTAGVGLCMNGTSTCDANGVWGACAGEVTPILEVCANSLDENCNGVLDDSLDEDGDGWSRCGGDCCDTLAGCSVPTAMNPGAMEVTNGLDDNCDGTVDNLATASCSTAAKFTSVVATDVARAMDLCTTTTLAARTPGLINAQQLNANATTPTATVLANLQNKQMAVLTVFGNTVTPIWTATLAGLSTGMMRDSNDPGWVLPVSGSNLASTIAFPAAGTLGDYLAQNGGGLVPGSCGNATCPVGTNANDSAMVRLQLRVPTNATSFTFDYRFFSSEYQTYQCTQFNDHFLALLQSVSNPNQVVRNVAVNALGRPVSVNSGDIDVCGGNGKSCGTCPSGTAQLAGTGFDQVNGGATRWLSATAPVTAGEIITLDLMIFDVGDYAYDSDVLLDNFRWSYVVNEAASQPQ